MHLSASSCDIRAMFSSHTIFVMSEAPSSDLRALCVFRISCSCSNVKDLALLVTGPAGPAVPEGEVGGGVLGDVLGDDGGGLAVVGGSGVVADVSSAHLPHHILPAPTQDTPASQSSSLAQKSSLLAHTSEGSGVYAVIQAE